MPTQFNAEVTSASEGTERKLCTYCSTYKPLDEFRRHHKGGTRRHAECRQCRNELEEKRRAAMRTRRTKQFLTELRRARSERQRDQVFALFIRMLGGVEGFAKELVLLFDAAKESGNPSLAIRVLLVLVEAKAAADAVKPTSAIDYENLSDEDLRRALRNVFEFIDADGLVHQD